MRQYEVEHLLTHCMKRQGILHREDPPPYAAITHETALRMSFGRSGRNSRSAQASHRHLIGMSELAHVSLDAEAQLSKYRSALDRMDSCAIASAESRDFIHHSIRDI